MTARYAIIEQRFLITIYKIRQSLLTIRSQPNCFEFEVVVVATLGSILDSQLS